MSIALTLSIPELFDSIKNQVSQNNKDSFNMPALQALLAKSDRFIKASQSSYATSRYLFHQPKSFDHEAALASVMASVELDKYDKQAYWLRVDPVQMVVDRDALILIPAQALAISEQESQALINAFNEHFKHDKVVLEYASPYSWYLKMAQPVDLRTHTLESVAYHSIREAYPEGNAAMYWRKMINEAQMLFFNHPVNESRRAQGKPDINSIWIWGEGQLTDRLIVQRPEVKVWSSDLYLRGLANLANSEFSLPPKTYHHWEVQKKSLKTQQTISHHIIHLEGYSKALCALQKEGEVRVLQQLEEEWFSPILRALKNREITSVLLELGGDFRYHLIPSHVYRFWRFKSDLTKL